MVEQGNQTQPELFEEFAKMPRKRRRRKLRLPKGLSFTISYENIIFGAILLVMAMIVCFTLGIERGKRIGLRGHRAEPQPSVGREMSRDKPQPVVGAKPREVPAQLSRGPVQERTAPGEEEVVSVTKEEVSPTPSKPELTPDDHQLAKEEIGHRAEETRYAIQLITYTRQGYAEKELAKLKEKGLTPYMVRSGRFFVVYIGPYESYDEAQSILKEFKSKASYRSAFLKELKR